MRKEVQGGEYVKDKSESSDIPKLEDILKMPNRRIDAGSRNS